MTDGTDRIVTSSRAMGLLLVALLAMACGGRASPAKALPAGSTIAIVGVTVVHPALDGAAAEEGDRTVILAGDRIVAVGPTVTTAVPAGARVIDGHGKWLIPGLIDSHVHFFQSGNPFTRPDAADFTDVVPYADEVARNKARLPATFKVWLASGVTSVVDTGGPMWNFEVRDQARRTEAAPRVLVAGPLVSLIPRKKLELDDPPIIQVTTADEARALVTAQLPHHPDFVKVWFIHIPSGDLAAEEAIVRAAAETAHAAHVRVLVHATELATAKAAMRAGADILVHSVFDLPVDDEFLSLAKEHHVILVPTLWVFHGYATVLSGTFVPTEEELRLADPEVLAAMSKVPRLKPEAAGRADQPASLENLPRIWAAGIPVALGTDAGNIGTFHGPGFFREARMMVQAGLTPLQVLRASCVNGAKVLGLEADLGDVAVGKLADLVVLDADPLLSVDNWSHAHVVIRAGHVFDPVALMASLAH